MYYISITYSYGMLIWVKVLCVPCCVDVYDKEMAMFYSVKCLQDINIYMLALCHMNLYLVIVFKTWETIMIFLSI